MRVSIRRLGVAITTAATVGATIVGGQPVLAAPSTPGAGSSIAATSHHVTTGRRVVLRDLPRARGFEASAPQRRPLGAPARFAPAPGTGRPSAMNLTAAATESVPAALAPSLGGGSSATPPAPLFATTQVGFQGIDEPTVASHYSCPVGAVPCIEPPDPWVGVDSGHVVQAVNTLIRVFNRSGSPAPVTTDLSVFFGAPAGQQAIFDPRFIFDAVRQRWLATASSFDCTAGHLYLAVSATADPTGAWTVFTFDDPGSIPDFPGLGTSSDKVVLSTNEFGIGPMVGGVCDGTTFTGATLHVFDWDDAIDGNATVASTVLGPDANTFSWRPGFAFGPGLGSTVFLTGLGPNADVMYDTLDGTNKLASVALGTARDLTTDPALVTAHQDLFPYADPPAPHQLGGTIANALDGRPTDALWAGGHLYVSTTSPCVAPGVPVFDCARVLDLNTAANGTPSPELLYGLPGVDSYMPGIGLAGDGTLHMVFTRSNAYAIPGVWHTWRAPTDPPGSWQDERLIQAGVSAYKGDRWGDYVGVARDPTNPHAVWQADQYPTASGTWATWVSSISLTSIGTNGTVTRIGGANRYDTAAKVSAATFKPGIDVVYVATGTNFPDALAGGPAAAYQGGALLLVTPTAIPAPTATELTRLAPKRIVVLGGVGAISTSVEVGLRMFTSSHLASSVTRVSGASRYDTAAKVSAAVFPTGVPVVFVATGANFPDALGGGPAAALTDGPLLLVSLTSIPAATQAELTRLKPEFIVVLGGTGVISTTVRGALVAYTRLHSSAFVVPESGSTRYDTAASVVGDFFSPGVAVAYVATGTTFPDALAAGPAAGLEGSPIALVTPTSVPLATKTLLAGLKPHRIVVLGGTGAISDAVKNSLATYVVP